jgi:hypothetical protein
MSIVGIFKDKLYITLGSIQKYINCISNLMIKSDDENLKILLKNPKDKAQFQKAIDEILRDNKKEKEIDINGSTIVISM